MIQIIDGDTATQKFELSDKDDLKPGKDIEIKAGYGDVSADVPEDIRHAVLIKMADFFANRESIIEGINTGLEASPVIRELLFHYKVFGTGAVVDGNWSW